MKDLRFSVGPHISGGIGIQFPKPIAWVVLSREQALEMAFALLKHAGTKIEVAPRKHISETQLDMKIVWGDEADGNTNYPGS